MNAIGERSRGGDGYGERASRRGMIFGRGMAGRVDIVNYFP